MIGAFSRALVVTWLLAMAASPATADPKLARGLKFQIGVYDPKGSSESSRYRPSRKPVQQDRYAFQTHFCDQIHPSPAAVCATLGAGSTPE